VAAQFCYVAAQTGIFSFFINYMATETPVLSQAQANALQSYADGLHAIRVIPPARMTYPAALFNARDITNLSALVAKLQNDSDPQTQPISRFLWAQFSTNQDVLTASGARAAALLDISTNETPAKLQEQITQKQQPILLKAMNQVLQTNLLFAAVRSSGMALPGEQRQLIEQNPQGEQLVRANRAFLEDTYSSDLIARSPYLHNAEFRVTDRGGSVLLSFGGFALFLLGRITGSLALRVFKAQSILALYGFINIGAMVLAMFPLGWWSVAGLFVSFFFMSIMYPTIFALGIHGLGEQTKLGSSFIVQAIVGGALMPLLMGWLADNWGMRIGFLMPLLCFIFIAFYGAAWQKLEARDAAGKG
jgi:hypothetical protein